MSSEHILITIVFGIPKSAGEKLSTLSKQLVAKYLPDQSRERAISDPHITIYQAKFPKDKEEEVYEVLKQYTATHSPVRFTPKGVNVKNQFVGIGFEKTAVIDDIHQALVNQLNQLRGGLVKSVYIEKRDEFSPEEQQNIDMWGYPHVMNVYQPHLTLIALDDIANVEKAAADIDWQETFESDEIEAVALSNGEKIIHTFKFGHY